MRCRARCAPDRDWYFAFSVCSASRSLRSHLASGITHNAMAINQANQKNENVHVRSGCGGTGGPLPRIPRRDTCVPHRSSPGPCVRRHVCWCDGTCVRVSVCVLVMFVCTCTRVCAHALFAIHRHASGSAAKDCGTSAEGSCGAAGGRRGALLCGHFCQ